VLPTTLGGVAILLLFFVPGFLSIQTKRRLIVLKGQSPFEEAMSAVAVSAVLLLAVELVAGAGSSKQGFLLVLPAKTGVVNISPRFWIRYSIVLSLGVMAGSVWAGLLRTSLPERLQERVGFRVGVVPGPWDRLFSVDNEWIRVHLVNGWMIDGWKQYASAYPDAHELLLGDVVIYDDTSAVRGNCDDLLVTNAQISFVEHRPHLVRDEET
jgi:hypothetical protein